MPKDYEPLRIAIIGTGGRSSYMYAPLIAGLSDEVALVSVWGRSEASAKALGLQLRVPFYTDMDRLVRETSPDIGIVSVKGNANGEVGLMTVQSGLHLLIETPIAYRLSEADAIIQTAREKNLKIEVAEQFHRRPMEEIKRRLIASGLFGRVYSAFNDFAGHGYHGVSVLRSYLGFDARPKQVVGSVHSYELAPQWSAIANTRGPRTETQEHGIIEFEGGQVGIYHWTSVGYDSPVRWWRSSRFLAEKGMGVSIGTGTDTDERLTLLARQEEAPRLITIERRYERVDGGALTQVVAHTGDAEQPVITWENPFRPRVQGHGVQWHDDEIGVAGCIMSLVNAVRGGGEVTYGGLQGRLDQEIVLAIQRSAADGGRPVAFPVRE